jgi:hypothetical protein
MDRPRSRPAIVAVLALAYPILVVGLGAAAFVLSALLTREDGSDEFADFDEGGALIFALLLALPVVVVVAHVAWAALAGWLLPNHQPAGIAGAALLLAMASIATFVVLGAGVGPVNPDGWAHVAFASGALGGLATVAAITLTRPRRGSVEHRPRGNRSDASIP